MTVIGFSLLSPDQALAWADCQVFQEDSPVGHAPKLIVNATAAIVAAGTGWSSLCRGFGHVVTDALSLDRLAEMLPAYLRREAAVVSAKRPDPETFAGNSFFTVGWSERFQRLVGYSLEAQSYFEPRQTMAFASPESSELRAMHPGSFDDLHGLIAQQIVDLKLPTGGRVIGATIQGRAVSARTVMSLPKAEPKS